MIYLLIIGLELLAVRLLGGRVVRLGSAGFRRIWLLVAGGMLMTLAIDLFGAHKAWHPQLWYLAAWLCIVAFLVANRRIRGAKVLIAGSLSNFVAVAINGGTMPMTKWAERTAGLTTEAGQWYNSMPLAHPKLWFLGDVFALPKALGPLANVFSIGDVLIFIGFGILIWTTAFNEALDYDADGNPVKRFKYLRRDHRPAIASEQTVEEKIAS